MLSGFFTRPETTMTPKRLMLAPFVLAVALTVSACATGTLVVTDTRKISTERVVALDAPVAPWVAQIEVRLKERGFKVKRLSRDTSGSLANLGARYVLRINADYYAGWERRCFGGGYKFHAFTAELMDLEANEALASVSGEGYSEDCPPLSGTIFGDVANMVADRWQ